jgi:UDP-N-acetyl-2-amino-2-deoxyglucuronate dehydrogenase
MTSFALIGAAGYIAPRHMKSVGGELKLAFDPNDSVGVMDSYFPEASFSTEFERFDWHFDMLRRKGDKISYANYPKPLHEQSAYRRFPSAGNGLPVSEKLAKEVFALPMHAYLDEDTQNYIIDRVKVALLAP